MHFVVPSAPPFLFHILHLLRWPDVSAFHLSLLKLPPWWDSCTVCSFHHSIFLCILQMWMLSHTQISGVCKPALQARGSCGEQNFRHSPGQQHPKLRYCAQKVTLQLLPEIFAPCSHGFQQAHKSLNRKVFYVASGSTCFQFPWKYCRNILQLGWFFTCVLILTVDCKTRQSGKQYVSTF